MRHPVQSCSLKISISKPFYQEVSYEIYFRISSCRKLRFLNDKLIEFISFTKTNKLINDFACIRKK